MKALVKHLLSNNREQILKRSLRNCHTVGLHSIMLYEAPKGQAGTIRLFYARGPHNMHRNSPDSHEPLSIAFHPHHCNVSLVRVFGTVYNWTVDIGPVGEHPVDPFLYSSQISTGQAGFEKLQNTGVFARTRDFSPLTEEGTRMLAREIHTVYVPRNECAAWFVFEGAEDPGYNPTCWSNDDLANSWTNKYLYEPMESREIWGFLRDCGLV